MLPEIVSGWDSGSFVCVWVWVYAHEDVSKWPELDPQEFHRRVMGQCGQSNNCLLSLAVSFCAVLKGQSPSCSTAYPIPHIFFCRGRGIFFLVLEIGKLGPRDENPFVGETEAASGRSLDPFSSPSPLSVWWTWCFLLRGPGAGDMWERP